MRLLLSCFLLCTSVVAFAQPPTTPEALMEGVLRALQAKDLQSLRAYTVGAAEVKKYVWPPVARNMTGTMNSEMFAAMYLKASDTAAVETMERFAGTKWQVVKVAVEEPSKPTKGYRLILTPAVTIRDDSGFETTMPIVGGILETGGLYKVTTYYVSPLQR